jgi:hypothetical protein
MAPSEHDGSSEEDDGSDNHSADENDYNERMDSGSEGPSRHSVLLIIIQTCF